MIIYDKLKDDFDSGIISFSMPGHKYGRIFSSLGYTNKAESLYKLDTTEIIGTDNLHEPTGIILKSQENTARIICGENKDYNLKYLVNGTTCGVEAAICSILNDGDKIIMGRASHKSAYNALMMSGAVPVYIKENISKDGVLVGSDVDDMIAKITKNPDAKLVFLTRPTYYGMNINIERIIKSAHSRGMKVVVDEAHGAHMGLFKETSFEDRNRSSIEYGADIVIQSVHKSLPAMTQTSVMLIRKDFEYMNRLDTTLGIFESSSPSYVMMMSTEIAYDIYEKHGRSLMRELINNIEVFKKSVKKYRFFKSDDPTKIFINTIDHGFNGYDFAKLLRYKYNIQVEMSNYSGILLLCTIANTKSDFVELKNALDDILKNNFIGLSLNFFESGPIKDRYEIKSINESENIEINLPVGLPEVVKTPREAFSLEKERISIEDSVGRISGEFVIPYPPGICVLAPGERIDESLVEFLRNARSLGIEINGIESKDFLDINVLK